MLFDEDVLDRDWSMHVEQEQHICEELGTPNDELQPQQEVPQLLNSAHEVICDDPTCVVVFLILILIVGWR